MKFISKRKAITAISAVKSVKKINDGETWLYGASKLPANEYHEIPLLSAHVIKDLANPNMSDYYLWKKYVKRSLPRVDSAKFILGTAFHTAVLEPHLYNDSYAIQPKFDRRTKQGKSDYADWVTENEGKQILTHDQNDTVKAMTKVTKSNQFSRAVLQYCKSEVTGVTRLPCGTLIKGRIDAVNFAGQYGVDLKSADDVSPGGFAKASAQYRYDIQAYTYKKLFNLDEFIFVVVSKTDPIEVSMYTLNDEFMEKAERDFNFAVERWNRINSIEIPSGFINYDNPLIVLAPPKWFAFS
tara:strand:- start:4960 stop:5850 length:891 start_codon:yes stop_codon:yes gene_type:complete